MASQDDLSEVWVACSFVPTVEDALVFLRHHAESSKQVRDVVRRGWVSGVAMAAPTFVLLVATDIASRTHGGAWLRPYLSFGAPAVVVTGAAILAGMVLLRGLRPVGVSAIRKTFEAQARSGAIELDLRPTTITIGPNGVVVDRGTSRTWYAWERVQKLIERDDCFLVYHSREQAVTVPRRAFAAPEQADEFRQRVESHARRAAGVAGTPPTVPAIP